MKYLQGQWLPYPMAKYKQSIIKLYSIVQHSKFHSIKRKSLKNLINLTDTKNEKKIYSPNILFIVNLIRLINLEQHFYIMTWSSHHLDLNDILLFRCAIFLRWCIQFIIFSEKFANTFETFRSSMIIVSLLSLYI